MFQCFISVSKSKFWLTIEATAQVLKLASRFERLLKQRRECATSHGKNDDELLADLVGKYNSFKANAALKRWQISSDTQQAVWAIIIGMDETSRTLLRAHLDHNKWEESGASMGIMFQSQQQSFRCFCFVYSFLIDWYAFLFCFWFVWWFG